MSENFRIGSDHPALPGHFPGRPVVPGVVLLDRVAAALERWRGQRIATLPQVKFLLPLLPEEDAELHLDDDGRRIHFRVLRNGMPIANGIVTLAPEPATASGAGA
ncbi:MAG: hydroxymyristoyl-ACP dehydratase [Rudaea sp.]